MTHVFLGFLIGRQFRDGFRHVVIELNGFYRIPMVLLGFSMQFPSHHSASGDCSLCLSMVFPIMIPFPQMRVLLLRKLGCSMHNHQLEQDTCKATWSDGTILLTAFSLVVLFILLVQLSHLLQFLLNFLPKLLLFLLAKLDTSPTF